ncbi:MAG: alpha/beta hydrolase [Lautropia sp.]|nr:alpha/beta hydrolase [Lautropia sp.]
MNPATQLLTIPGPAGAIDVALDLPGAGRGGAGVTSVTGGTGGSAGGSAADGGAPAVTGIAVIAHPHPLHGGTRDNKVVQTMVRALLLAGCACWRPNFRGVGGTAGQFDEGRGEAVDLRAVVDYAAAHESARGLAAPVRLHLAGFSFGSYVQTVVAQQIDPLRFELAPMILLGIATSRFDVLPVPQDTLVIHGEIDDVVPLQTVMDWARPQSLPIIVLPGSGHYFHGQLNRIKNLILRNLGLGAS